jgi:hypothetical protein
MRRMPPWSASRWRDDRARRLKSHIVVALLLVPLGGCVSGHGPVTAEATPVADGDMVVMPRAAWTRLPASMSQTRWEEVWTRNGPQLDRLALLGGMPEGRAILVQEKHANQQVPLFRADMTPQDLMSMLEVSYRVQGVAVFDFESVEPVDFLGGPGVRMRYDYLSGIGFKKQGWCVMRIVGAKLYSMKLEGVASRDFDTVALEFDQLVASAKLRR